MAHISGIVAAQKFKSPFELCDIVTSTTHKTLAGPRSGIIFFKKELESRINFSVFPGLQGGPHQNKIAALAYQLKEVNTPEFNQYIEKVISNTQTMVNTFKQLGYKLSTDGSDNHLLLIDLKPQGITGSKVEYICELVDISLNKNSVFGDKSAVSPGGIRIGTSAMTTRGCNQEDFTSITHLIHQCVQLGLKAQENHKKLTEFKKNLQNFDTQINEIKTEVHQLTQRVEFIEY